MRSSASSGVSACFNTQPPEGGWKTLQTKGYAMKVSTHSRLKAAGRKIKLRLRDNVSFNTQPPEGGWSIKTLL